MGWWIRACVPDCRSRITSYNVCYTKLLRSLWNRELIAEGVALATEALTTRFFGPYGLQAAIAAVHAEAPSAAETDWSEIIGLYDVLSRLDPSPVVSLNRAVAVASYNFV